MLVVMDFDGTLTDAEAEGAPFVEGQLEDLAELTGRPLDEIHAMADRFRAEVEADPEPYGWQFKGAIVAPAIVDPYLRIMPVTRKILDACGVMVGDPEARERLIGQLYRSNYPKTRCVFREGAGELLMKLKGRSAWIVTNALPDHIEGKIRRLDEAAEGDLRWLLDRVKGGAQKHVLDPEDGLVEERLMLPGLSRPILLRRRHYRELLTELKGELPWDEVLVVGDIFELDLSLPLALGARVALVANDYTPPWELAFVEAHPRGQVIHGLAELEAALQL